MKKSNRVAPEEGFGLSKQGDKRGGGESVEGPKRIIKKKKSSLRSHESLKSLETEVSIDDRQFIPPEIERLRIRKTLRAAADLVSFSVGRELEDEAAPRTKKQRFIDVLREYCAKADVFASAHVVPKHRICISAAAFFIPISLVLMSWDFLATIVFQIPQLSSINSPGFILFVNFIAMPIAMYGYMMEYLMHENSRHAKLALACVVCHPILFGIRAYMEFAFDGYRNELKLYFE